MTTRNPSHAASAALVPFSVDAGVAAIAALVAFAALALAACAPSRPARAGLTSDDESLAAKFVADAAPLSGDSVFDRGKYGTAPIPFWCPLTAPEIRALQARELAAAGDAHALLDLAILASGDIRDDSGYADIRARFDAFVAKEAKALAKIKSERTRGQHLLIDMHAHFFLAGRSDGRGIRPGYLWAQSSVTGIFATRKFNCISSSILYVTLARALGLKADGVAMPTHAFAQVTLSDGTVVEIETTTPEGFGVRHNKDFYAGRGTGWFTARGLPSATYADYLSRRILPPDRLIAFNMWNQHAMADGRSLEDRYRLAEARAWIDPGDAKAQHNLMAVYASEGGYLTRALEWATLERMGRAILPAMPASRKRWDAEPDVPQYIAWVPWYHASALRGLGRGEEAFPWIDSTLAWIKPGHAHASDLRSNAIGLVVGITQDMARDKRFAAAEKILIRYGGTMGQDPEFRAHLAWFYATWAGEAWKREDWPTAAARLGKGLGYEDRKGAGSIRENLAAVYSNQAADHFNDGREDKALASLRLCLEKIPDAKPCRERIRELKLGKN